MTLLKKVCGKCGGKLKFKRTKTDYVSDHLGITSFPSYTQIYECEDCGEENW